MQRESAHGAIIEMREIEKVYRGCHQAALRGVRLDIRRRQAISIVGRSGGGKSTLLNIMATLDFATAGRYSFDGETIAARPRVGTRVARGTAPSRLTKTRHEHRTAELRRRMGFVFQTPFMLSNFSVAYNLELPFVVSGQPLPAGATDAMLQRLGLEDHARYTADKLSGGQRQRVAIGRALLHRPEVVFADEPTGSLDIKTARDVMTLLREVCDDTGATLVLVTHQPELACEFTDRVVGIADGRVSFDHEQARVTEVETFLRMAG